MRLLRHLLPLPALTLVLAGACRPPPPGETGRTRPVDAVALQDLSQVLPEVEAPAGEPFAPPWMPAPRYELPADAQLLGVQRRALAAAQPSAEPSPAPRAGFLGASFNGQYVPPDTHGAVGPRDILVTLNGTVRVLDRAGTTLSGTTLNGFWSPLGLAVTTFDPRALFDPYGGRFIVASCGGKTSADSNILLAVSAGDSAAGTWTQFKVTVPPADGTWADFPSVGFNSHWIAVQVNMFDDAGSFVRSHLYLFDKAALYAASNPVAAPTYTLLQPANGATLVPATTLDPSEGTLYLLQNYNGDFQGSGYLRMAMVSGAVGAESLSEVGFVQLGSTWTGSPTTNFLPQLGSENLVNAGDPRMQSVVLRDGTLWAAHAVFVPADAPTHVAVQWVQLGKAGNVLQHGRVEDATGTWSYAYPALSVNARGEALLGFSSFSASSYASAAYAARLPGDPPNTFREVGTLKAGEGPYSWLDGKGRNRWGDYSATVVDPDGLQLWTLQEYALAGNGWSVWWGRFDLGSPLLAFPGNQVVAESQQLSVQLAATSPYGRALTYAASPLPTGATLDAATGALSWTPGYSQAGNYTLTASATDSQGLSDSHAVTISVVNTNRPPELLPTADKSVAEGAALSFTVLAMDPDLDALSYAASPLPPGATFNPTSHSFSWTPGYDQAGTWTVTLSASDGAAVATDAVDIVVANTNRSPTLATPGTKSVAEGSLLTVTFSGSDPDGEPLTYGVSPLPPGAALDASAGTFTWTPGYSQSGAWSMTVTVTDGVAFATAAFNVTVSNTNRPPTLAGTGPAQVDEGTEWLLALSAADPDGASVTLSCTGLPAGAVLEPFASRVRWVPTFDQSGTHAFDCSATDGDLSTQASFSVTVLHVNRPPAWSNVPPSLLREGTAESVPLGAIDPDGDVLSYSATGLPPGASYDAQTGMLTWTPDFTQAGSWPVTLTASDGQASASRTLALVVADTNLPPSVEPLPPATVREGQLLELAVFGSDGDGDVLTWSASGLPVGATFDAATRQFRFQPDFGQAGSYTVTFTARDELLSGSAALTVTVTLGNRPPSLDVPGPRTLSESELVTFTVSGSDPEGLPVTFGARDLPEGATFDAPSRTFRWTPSYAQAGTWSVTFTASDGEVATEAQVELVVENVNRGPVLAPQRPPQVFAGGPVTLTFNAVDPEGDAVTYSADPLPAGATLDPATGRFDWVPSEAQVGQVVMRLRATDPGGRGSELSMTFQVQGALVTGCSAVGGAWPLGVLMYVLAARRRRPRRGT